MPSADRRRRRSEHAVARVLPDIVMNLFGKIWSTLRLLTQRRAVKSEIDEELRFHIERRTAENVAAGMSAEEAAREARKRFGNFQSVREECRGARGASLFETTWKDIRFGARMLRRNPGFTTIAVLTLALGIGATSAVFSLIQGVLLTPPPYPKPNQIVLIQPARVDGRPYAKACSTSQWLQWKDATNCFKAVAGYSWGMQYLIQHDGSQFVDGLYVTPDYFKLTGVKPLLGREFSQADMASGTDKETTIILGYDLWQRQFHGDPNILGKVIHLSRLKRPLTVIGVMPPGVRFLPMPDDATEPNYNVNAKVDYWMPHWLPNLKQPETGYCDMVGRLRDGVSPAQAQAELRTMASRQAKLNATYQGITAKVEPLIPYLNREGSQILLPLMGAVALVFLIACANVAGLLLARGLQRQQEYALRCALGAQRSRLFRQVLTESLLVSLSGGVLGIGLAVGIVRVLKAIGGHAIPRLDAVGIGWPVLMFCLGAAILAAILAGLAPAIYAVRSDVGRGLSGTRTSGLNRRERHVLGGVAAIQIALTFALLVGAGLLIRTIINLDELHPGYVTQNMLTMDVTSVNGLQAEELTQVAALPGVRHVAFAWGTPLTGNDWMCQWRIEGQSEGENGTGAGLKDEVALPTRAVSADYFNTLELGIVAGRSFRLSDRWFGPGAVTNAPFVAVVNQAMERKYFAGQDPIGKRIRFYSEFQNFPSKFARIIGVVADSRDGSLVQKPAPEIYLYFFQYPAFIKRLIIRTVSDPLSFIGVVQRELRAIDPTVAIDHIETMQQIRANSIASQTFAMRLLAGFSLLGTVLALVGIYGVLSLSVGSRKREIAIRAALGAQRGQILGLVLSEGCRLLLVGLVAGTVLALVTTRMLSAFLFGVQPTDPVTFMVVVILFTAVTLLACLIPACRATRIDPMAALRCE